MHRLALVGIVLAAVLTALPVSARTFRTDLTNCQGAATSPDTIDTAILYCWDSIPFALSFLEVEFPTNNQPATPFDFAVGGGLSEPPLSPNPNRFFGYGHNQPSEPFNFNILAFDYPQFLIDIGNPSGAGLVAPQGTITRGLARLNDPANGNPFEIPLLRINWLLDFDQLGGYTNIFEPFFNPETNGDSVGVQLIFYGDNPSFAVGLPVPYPVPGVGFEINGLVDTKTYTSTTLWWQDDRAPCSSFGNDGQSLCSPTAEVAEPSSVALLGLGFLALVAGLRTRGPLRAQQLA